MALKDTIFLSVSLAVLALDQITKFLVRERLGLGESVPVVGNLLNITHTKNYGVAFGLLNYSQLRWLFIIISVTVIAIIIIHYKRIPDKKLASVAFALLLAGTIGNLVDRLFLGFVVDFIDFWMWPAFNIADSAITIAVITLILIFWKS